MLYNQLTFSPKELKFLLLTVVALYLQMNINKSLLKRDKTTC